MNPIPPEPGRAFADPFEIYGPLFEDVQQGEIFTDQKTFPDCQPKLPPTEILARYRERKGSVNLREFVFDHFFVPETPHLQAFVSETIDHHLETVWPLLQRDPAPPVDGSSLLPLARPYLIPGGRFREVYYWDSYFAMLGLRLGGRETLIRDMTDNFADLINRFGLIPNGNRTYYLTRSHPPFFAFMVEFIAEQDGADAYRRYLPALEGELAYWNDRTRPTKHSVTLPGGHQLHRYYDQVDIPRIEAFGHDQKLQARSHQAAPDFHRNMRSAAESGWDFSSRWFMDGNDLEATSATDLVPVDLNCFLFQLERTLARACAAEGKTERSQFLNESADARSRAIARFCWSDVDNFFFDYDLRRGATSSAFTLAAVAPLFVGIATQAQADAVATTLRARFLQPGGLVTTLVQSGQQWDWPNGWAPLQWMAIAGLRQYGHENLAKEIALRWIALNGEVFRRTGRLLEKYNVVDLSLPAGGGEYPTQDGFAWTNGVLVRLRRDYPH
jgi:alpha,alpha-trehalase